MVDKLWLAFAALQTPFKISPSTPDMEDTCATLSPAGMLQYVAGRHVSCSTRLDFMVGCVSET
jgi:hypothetical protein